MSGSWKAAVGSQFGAATAMLENAMVACPEALWSDRSREPEFWYVAFHALFWLDYYLAGSPEGFVPPAPFTLDELDPAGRIPERPYTKEQLLGYLRHGRARCRRVLADLTDEVAGRPCGFAGMGLTVGELHLYNLRHVQHHAAQLNLLLRMETGSAPRWVKRAPGPGA